MPGDSPAMSTPLPPTAVLCAEPRWLAQLAVRLVDDRDTAQDVAQDAALAALRTKPTTRAGRAWLRGTVRNLALDVRRRRARRERAERVAGDAQKGAAPSAAEAATRLEQQRLLAEAVLALESPFRDVVLLRFYEGLTPEAAAHRLGLPRATVYSRTTRALQRLRGALDAANDGNRAAWVAAFASLRPSAGKASVAPAATGVLAVGAVALWCALPGEEPAKPTISSEPGRQAAMVAMREAPVAPPPAAGTRTAAAKPQDPIRGALVRIVDGITGAPATDATVHLLIPQRLEQPALRRAHERAVARGDDLWRAATRVGQRLAIDGLGTCSMPIGAPGMLVGESGDRRGVLRVPHGQHVEAPLDLRLWPVRRATVRVVGEDGAPRPGIQVALVHDGGTNPLSTARTRADGTAELTWFRGIHGRSERLVVGARLLGPLGAPVHTALPDDGAPPETPFELRLPATGTVAVHVSLDGAPAPDGTPIWLYPDAPTSPAEETRVPAPTHDGTARFAAVGLGVPFVAAHSPWPGALPSIVSHEGLGTAGEVVELRLTSSDSLTKVVGRLPHALGEAGSASVRLFTATDEAVFHAAIHPGQDGRFTLHWPTAIEHIATQVVLFEHEGERRTLRVSLPERSPEQVLDLGELAWPRSTAALRGTVLDPQGAPIAGASVWRMRRSDASSSGFEHVTNQRVATTGTRGEFAMPDAPATETWLAVRARGWRHDPQHWHPAAGAIVLRPEPAASLRGRLHSDSGIALDRLGVEAWPDRLGSPSETPTGWVGGIIDLDGEFHIDRLQPGSHTLIVTGSPRRELARLRGIIADRKNTPTPGLDPIDLSDLVRPIPLRAVDEHGAPLTASVWAWTPGARTALGKTGTPLVVPSSLPIELLLLRCEGYFPIAVPIDQANEPAVLSRGHPVDLTITGATTPGKGLALRARLRASHPGEGPTRPSPLAAISYKAPSKADVDAAGRVRLAAPRPGAYRVSLSLVHRADGLEIESAMPHPSFLIQVGAGSPASVELVIAPAVMQQAYEALQARLAAASNPR